ncbi:hypothetical protein K402DRAFT_29650 [Aulographum hederae CBS 113979]|uniref:Uncharacterized protein n=1 Tax=Aulographum hederae CBS 113979 TaxID=1176131 RepID=A0A6G1H5A4_9PEZI|nr:hypothetical protein K402DRAFT_29650 [Aulographum hederae CBS 113979]
MVLSALSSISYFSTVSRLRISLPSHFSNLSTYHLVKFISRIRQTRPNPIRLSGHNVMAAQSYYSSFGGGGGGPQTGPQQQPNYPYQQQPPPSQQFQQPYFPPPPKQPFNSNSPSSPSIHGPPPAYTPHPPQHSNNPPYPATPPHVPQREQAGYLRPPSAFGSKLDPSRSYSSPPDNRRPRRRSSGSHVRFEDSDADDRRYSGERYIDDDSESSRETRRDRHRSRSRSGHHSHHRKHSFNADKERRDRDTFLGAGGGALLGDALFPGLGTVGGLLLGGWGGHHHAKKRSRSSTETGRHSGY